MLHFEHVARAEEFFAISALCAQQVDLRTTTLHTHVIVLVFHDRDEWKSVEEGQFSCGEQGATGTGVLRPTSG